MSFKKPVLLWLVCTLSVVFVLRPDVGGSIEPPTSATATLGHPRLFFTARDIPRLQGQAATTHREI